MFLVWPHRINPKEDPQRFQVFVAKNRNRGIMQGIVDCRFIPSRQMILPPKVSDMANHSQELARFNRGGFD
jgi:hypothetical protein